MSYSQTILKVAVSATVAPKIVGKQGSCVKLLMSSSGANIAIDRNDMPGGVDDVDPVRAVTISGTTNAVCSAVALLIEKLEELEGSTSNRRRTSDRQPNPDVELRRSRYGGIGGGGGGGEFDAAPRDFYDGGRGAWPGGGGGGGSGGRGWQGQVCSLH